VLGLIGPNRRGKIDACFLYYRPYCASIAAPSAFRDCDIQAGTPAPAGPRRGIARTFPESAASADQTDGLRKRRGRAGEPLVSHVASGWPSVFPNRCLRPSVARPVKPHAGAGWARRTSSGAVREVTAVWQTSLCRNCGRARSFPKPKLLLLDEPGDRSDRTRTRASRCAGEGHCGARLRGESWSSTISKLVGRLCNRVTVINSRASHLHRIASGGATGGPK